MFKFCIILKPSVVFFLNIIKTNLFLDFYRWLHLGFNLVVQLLVGLPLEMVHGSGRVALIYMAGVIAGSLGTSVFDNDVYLVGASGGVYALLAAHLANVLLNYNNMQCGILRMFGIFAIGELTNIYFQYLCAIIIRNFIFLLSIRTFIDKILVGIIEKSILFVSIDYSNRNRKHRNCFCIQLQ